VVEVPQHASSDGAVTRAAALHRQHKPTKTAMLLAHSIIEELAEGDHPVGSILATEKQLLERYNVGRGVLREALRFLEIQGVLWTKSGPRGGLVVGAQDGSHLGSIITMQMQVLRTPLVSVIEVRETVEPRAAGLAAERATAEQLENLGASVEEMRNTIGAVDPFLRSSAEFHDLIAWSAGNDLFRLLTTSLLWITDRTALGIDYSERRQRAVLTAHEQIYDAIRSNDAEAAEKLMHSHVKDFRRYLEGRYPETLRAPLRWEQAL